MKLRKSLFAILGVALSLCLAACGSSSTTTATLPDVFIGTWDASYGAPVDGTELETDDIAAFEPGAVTLEIAADATGTLTISDTAYAFTCAEYETDAFDEAVALVSDKDDGTLGILMKNEGEDDLYLLVTDSDDSYMFVFPAE